MDLLKKSTIPDDILMDLTKNVENYIQTFNQSKLLEQFSVSTVALPNIFNETASIDCTMDNEKHYTKMNK